MARWILLTLIKGHHTILNLVSSHLIRQIFSPVEREDSISPEFCDILETTMEFAVCMKD